jgi:hypothetical protein
VSYLPLRLCESARQYTDAVFVERILAQTERPADIVRQRLKQAGYNETDGRDLLGNEELSFLLKFVYKSWFLGPAVRFCSSLSLRGTDRLLRRKT